MLFFFPFSECHLDRNLRIKSVWQLDGIYDPRPWALPGGIVAVPADGQEAIEDRVDVSSVLIP